MSLYSQAANKRQKTVSRDPVKNCEQPEFFPGLTLVEYRPEAGPEDTLCYRHYHATERIHGRTMEDWLRPAVSFNYAFCQRNSTEADVGSSSTHRSWEDGSQSTESYKRRIKAAFEFFSKLGTKFWTFHDRDISPEGETLEETGHNMDEIIELILELQTRTGIKPLWVAPNLHSHSRYMNGSVTSPEVQVASYAAAQMKRALDMAHKLGSECFLFRGVQEGYDSALITDFSRELHNFSRQLKMLANYKDRLGYRGQLLLEAARPKMVRDLRRYHEDAMSGLYLLKHYNLERSFKMSLPPGHHLFLASAYGMLGSIDITQHSSLPNIKDTTLLMKTVIEQGGLQPGGLNIGVHLPRHSSDLKELMVAYVSHIEIYARGLRNAAKMVSDGVFAKNLQQRYLSFHTGFGSRLANGEATLEDCEDMARKQRGEVSSTCGNSQHWESVFSRYM